MTIGGIFALLTGAICWTLTEYTMHRFMAHHGKPRGRFGREHLAHHAKPASFTPLRVKIAVAIPISIAVFSGAFWGLGPLLGGCFTTGFLVTYFGYELIHWSLHVFPPHTAYGRWARRHHLAHHFENAKKNHGVTTPLWDHIFGTFMRPQCIRIPIRFTPVWLCDEDGEIMGPYRGTYALRSRADASSSRAPHRAVG